MGLMRGTETWEECGSGVGAGIGRGTRSMNSARAKEAAKGTGLDSNKA